MRDFRAPQERWGGVFVFVVTILTGQLRAAEASACTEFGAKWLKSLGACVSPEHKCGTGSAGANGCTCTGEFHSYMQQTDVGNTFWCVKCAVGGTYPTAWNAAQGKCLCTVFGGLYESCNTNYCVTLPGTNFVSSLTIAPKIPRTPDYQACASDVSSTAFTLCGGANQTGAGGMTVYAQYSGDKLRFMGCVACPVGTYMPVTGNSIPCSPASLGGWGFSCLPSMNYDQFVSTAAHNTAMARSYPNCVACGANQVASGTSCVTLTCPSGTYVRNAQVTNQQGGTGQTAWGPYNVAACETLPTHAVADTSNSNGFTCSSGYIPINDGTACGSPLSPTGVDVLTLVGLDPNTVVRTRDTCYRGQYAWNGFCIACPTGKYRYSTVSMSDNYANPCLDCDVGKYSTPQPKTVAESSPYSPTGGRGCLACNSNGCTGKVYDYASKACSCKQFSTQVGCNCLCNAGYSGATPGVCVPCDKGKSKDIASDMGCTLCSAGYYTNAVGSTQCDPVPANAVVNSSNVDGWDCNPGFVKDAGACVPTSPFCNSYGTSNWTCTCPWHQHKYESYTEKTYRYWCVQCPSTSTGVNLTFTWMNGWWLGRCQAQFSPSTDWTNGAYGLHYERYAGTDANGGGLACAPGYKFLNTVLTGDPENYQCICDGACPPTPNCTASHYSAGYSQCIACPKGKASMTGGDSGCISCGPGTYGDTIGAAVCKTLPPNTAAVMSGGLRVGYTCADGWWPWNGACVAKVSPTGFDVSTTETFYRHDTSCFGGQYAWNGFCVPCPVNHVRSGNIANTDNYTHPCQPCPSGKYATPPLQTVAQSSPYIPTGGKTCSTCVITADRGLLSVAGARTCAYCDADFDPAKGTMGRRRSYVYTFAAPFPDASGVCRRCLLGSFASSSWDPYSCQKCPAGKYGVKYDALSEYEGCASCPMGRFMMAAPINHPYFLPPTEDEAYSTYRLQLTQFGDRGACFLCPSGRGHTVGFTWLSIGHTSDGDCQPCPFGYQLDSSTGVCHQCPLGFYRFDSNTVSCTSCPPGTSTTMPGAIYSMQTDAAGLVSNPNPLYRAQSNNYCGACPAGKYANSPATPTCTACPSGKVSNGAFGSAWCSSCEQLGFPVWYSASDDSTACVQMMCPAGTVPVRGTCTRCAPGRIAPTFGTAVCALCGEGQYSNGTHCIGPFPQNHMSCRSGTVFVDSECHPFARGKSPTCEGPPSPGCVGNSSACVACPPSYYSAWSNDTRFASPEGCLECPAGKDTQGLNGAAYCTACEAETVRPSIQFAMTHLWNGPVAYGNGSAYSQFCERSLACSACSYGKSFVAPNTSCVDCPVGKGIGFNNTRCEVCPVGRYGSDATVVCEACAPGRANPSSGAGACQACPEGSVALRGSSTCTVCPRGKFKIDAETCMPCTVGTAQRYPGAVQSCRPCDRGYYANQTGLHACLPCAMGAYAESTGTAQCVPCMPGRGTKYVGATNSTQCDACPAQTYSSGTGSGCLACPAGTFGNDTAAISCIGCTEAGTYVDYAGAEACSLCPPGKYAEAFEFTNATSAGGNTRCEYCPEGKYTSTNGSAFCRTCPSDSYLTTARDQCTRCQLINLATVPTTGECVPCPAGYWVDYTSNVTHLPDACTACPTGRVYVGAPNYVCVPTCATRDPNGTRYTMYVNTTLVADVVQLGRRVLELSAQSSNPNATIATRLLFGNVTAQYVNLSTAMCLDCPIGKYPAKLNLKDDVATTCYECPSGKAPLTLDDYATVGLTYPALPRDGVSGWCFLPCTNGTWLSLYDNATLALSSGNDTIRGQCLACPKGKYTTGPHPHLTCDACEEGTFSNADASSSCVQCPAGRFRSDLYLSDGYVAAWGPLTTYQAAERRAIVDSAVQGSACLPCPRGKIAPERGSSECKSCEAGSVTQPAIGGTQCKICTAGKYAAPCLNGSAWCCTDCPVGLVSYDGATTCVPCEGDNERPQGYPATPATCEKPPFFCNPQFADLYYWSDSCNYTCEVSDFWKADVACPPEHSKERMLLTYGLVTLGTCYFFWTFREMGILIREWWERRKKRREQRKW